MKKKIQMILYVVLSPKTFHRGLKLPITMTNVTTIFRYLTVNHEQCSKLDVL